MLVSIKLLSLGFQQETLHVESIFMLLYSVVQVGSRDVCLSVAADSNQIENQFKNGTTALVVRRKSAYYVAGRAVLCNK